MSTNYCPDYRFRCDTSSLYHHIYLFNAVCKTLSQPLLLKSYSSILSVLLWCYHLVLVLTCVTLLLAALKHSLDELRILSSPDQPFCLHILVCGDYVDLQ